ncbi:MAG: FecR family protein [Spirochaetia bacterium]|jgi:ferric-dicitrate binding protein FerR (iron transport regulator)
MGAVRRLTLGALVISALAGPAAVFALEGQVIYTEGTVTVTSGGSSQDAGPGTRLSQGDLVTTGPDGLAVIDLSNATQLKLRESTSVVIDAIGSDTKVSLTTGAVFTRILGKLSGSFSVQVERVVAGVRGTEFFVAYGRTIDSQRDIWLCVNSGLVDVSIPAANQHTLVPAGKGINIVGGEKLTPARSYTWTRGLNWNMDAANGGVQDHTSLDQAYSDLLNHDYQ